MRDIQVLLIRKHEQQIKYHVTYKIIKIRNQRTSVQIQSGSHDLLVFLRRTSINKLNNNNCLSKPLGQNPISKSLEYITCGASNKKLRCLKALKTS